MRAISVFNVQWFMFGEKLCTCRFNDQQGSKCILFHVIVSMRRAFHILKIKCFGFGRCSLFGFTPFVTLSKIGLLAGYIFKAKQELKQQNQARNQHFAKRNGGLNQKLKCFFWKNVSFKRRAEHTDATQAYHQRGSGAESSWAIFQQNMTIKSNIDHISHDCSHLK